MMFRNLAACLVLLSNWTATPVLADAPSQLPPAERQAAAPMLAVSAAPALPLSAPTSTRQYEQRSLYIQAKDAIRNARFADYRKHRAALDDYVIAPYLDYHYLRATISKTRTRTVTSFLKNQADLPATPLLKRAWLRSLGRNRQWQTYLKHYDGEPGADLQCYELRARYGTGRKKEALSKVGPIWTVPESLPKACDPLFKAWIASGGLTDERVWERLTLALRDNERSLARYLVTLTADSTKPMAQTFYGAHTQPEKSHRAAQLQQDSERGRMIVLHAAERLLRRDDARNAEQLWQARTQWDFSEEQRRAFEDALTVAKASKGAFPSTVPNTLEPSLVERLAETAIRQQRWEQALLWIDALPFAQSEQSRWRYWRNRARDASEGMTERVRSGYESLALERHYYGFLAAERVDAPAMLNEDNFDPDPIVLAQLHSRADLARALELYAVGERIAATREWVALLPELAPDERANAAYLAREIGWLRQSIHAANAAGIHNDLIARFPVAHMVEYRRMSHMTGVPLTLLLAITRQESAFDPQARSHANARGLMQLLPTTAEWVARRARLSRPTSSALYRPSTNIEIASHYLAMLLQRFNGSRPLAAAAYNAGERRVDRWIAERAGEPMDVWIENIPFRETRNYVQNVMAFSQVYAQKLNGDQPVPTLSAGEQQVPERRSAAQLGR
jgi:soluble lytic murein transglycosylase